MSYYDWRIRTKVLAMVWISTYLQGIVDNNGDIGYAFIADSKQTVLVIEYV